jgi:hypothetical protein
MEQTTDKTVSKTMKKELLDGAPTSGQVEVRLRNPKRTGSVTLRDYSVNGRQRPYIDEHGNFRVLRITKNILLNMENENDRLTYNQLKFHPKYTKGGNSVLTLHNIEEASADYVTLKDQEAEANAIVKELSGKKMMSFARVLLIPIKPGSSDSVIKRAIYEKVEANPTLVLEEYNSPDRELKEIIHEGVDADLFNKVNGVYSFKGQTIGTSFEMAISWLKNNDDLLPSIRKELK